MRRAQLIYEEECALCAASARWIERRAGGELEIVPFDDTRVPAGLGADRARAHLVEGDAVRHGGAAITAALRLGGWRRVAAVLDLPLVSRLRDGGYFLVARFHRPRSRG